METDYEREYVAMWHWASGRHEWVFDATTRRWLCACGATESVTSRALAPLPGFVVVGCGRS